MLRQHEQAIVIRSGFSPRVFTKDQIVQAAHEILHDGRVRGVSYWVLRTDRIGATVDLPVVSRTGSSPASILGNTEVGGIRSDGPVTGFVVMSGDWTNMALPEDSLEAYDSLTDETVVFAHRLHARLMRGPRNLGVLARFLSQVARRQRTFRVVQEQIPVIHLTREQHKRFRPIMDMLHQNGEL